MLSRCHLHQRTSRRHYLVLVLHLSRHGSLLHWGTTLVELGLGVATTSAAVAPEEARKPPLEGVLERQAGGGSPQKPLKGAKGGGRAGGAADGATAKQQLGQEDGQGNEAGKVEDDVGELESENGPWVVDCTSQP